MEGSWADVLRSVRLDEASWTRVAMGSTLAQPAVREVRRGSWFQTGRGLTALEEEAPGAMPLLDSGTLLLSSAAETLVSLMEQVRGGARARRGRGGAGWERARRAREP
jgi:hypothetical protein